MRNKSNIVMALCCVVFSSTGIAAEPDAEAKHLFILSGQSNMAGMDPNLSFTPAVTEAFGKDKVIVVIRIDISH